MSVLGRCFWRVRLPARRWQPGDMDACDAAGRAGRQGLAWACPRFLPEGSPGGFRRSGRRCRRCAAALTLEGRPVAFLPGRRLTAGGDPGGRGPYAGADGGGIRHCQPHMRVSGSQVCVPLGGTAHWHRALGSPTSPQGSAPAEGCDGQRGQLFILARANPGELAGDCGHRPGHHRGDRSIQHQGQRMAHAPALARIRHRARWPASSDGKPPVAHGHRQAGQRFAPGRD
jgi:hypothetical protein